MTKQHEDRATHKDEDAKAMHGVDLHLASAPAMTIGGESFSPATLKAVFQADIDAIDATDAERTVLKGKVAAAKVARTRAAKVRKNLKGFLIGQFGTEAVQILEDFGFAVPQPPGPKTAEKKAEGQAKARGTRSRKKAALTAAEDPPAPVVPAAAK